MMDEFVLDTDASDSGLGAVLSQRQNGIEKVIAYYSRTWKRPERSYCVTRRELLAIVDSMAHFHHFLYGRTFSVRTDHAALRWLRGFKNPEGQLARWLERLECYDFTIEHREGRSHSNADALSRRPCSADCGHCCKQESKADGEIQFVRHITVEPIAQIRPQNYNTVWVRQIELCAKISDNRTSGYTTPHTVLAVTKLSSEQIRMAQLQNPHIGQLLLLKEKSDVRPDWSVVAHLSAHSRAYWAQWDSLTVHDQCLVRVLDDINGRTNDRQILLPKTFRGDVFSLCHEIPVVGHFSIPKILEKNPTKILLVGHDR